MSFRQYRSFNKGEFIICAVDTASGLGDNTAAQFLSKQEIDVPLTFSSPATTSDFLPKLNDVLNKIYDVTQVKPIVALERQNGGGFLMDRLAGINLLGKYDLFRMPIFGRDNPPDAIKLGWDTTTATRPKMLSDLKDAIDKKSLIVYDQQTITEMYSFVVVKTTSTWKAQAEKHAKDDLVMSLAVAWQIYQIAEPQKTNADYTKILEELPKFNKVGKYGLY